MSKHINKLTLSIVCLFFFAQTLNAQWTSPGDGTTYTLTDLVEIGCVHHDYANSVYSIMTDITISATDKLYINGNDEPNSLLFNENNLTLTIKGSMVVEGTEDSHYYIGMPVYAEHGRIRFEDASEPNHFSRCDFFNLSGIQIIGSDVTFNDCNIIAFNTFSQSSTVSFSNCNPIFTDCSFIYNEGAAISSPANGQGSPQIVNCHFTNNVTSNANQPQITLGPGSNDTIRIMGCTIEGGGNNMVGGIAIADLMGTGATKILLKDNIVRNNRYGYNQQGYNLNSVINGNRFFDNNFETNPMNGGSGISIYGMDENNKAVLRNNVITGNLWGITVINAADVDLGTEDDWGRNQIHDNGNGGVLYDLYNNTPFDIMAVGNYWGTTNGQEIEDHIFHQSDDPSLGLVNYIPFLTDDAVNEVKTTGFEVWPNPVSNGSFTLVLDEATPSEVVIYNLKGQKVASEHIENKVNTINVSALGSGIFVVEVNHAEKKIVKRIIIE